MSSYKYTEHGNAYPTLDSYHENTGYFGKDEAPKRESHSYEPPTGNFEPLRTYPSQVMRSSDDVKFNWHMLRTSVVAIIISPCICSIIGLVYAMLSYVDHSNGSMLKYHRKKSCALGCSITALVLALLVIIAFIVGVILLFTTNLFPWAILLSTFNQQ